MYSAENMVNFTKDSAEQEIVKLKSSLIKHQKQGGSNNNHNFAPTKNTEYQTDYTDYKDYKYGCEALPSTKNVKHHTD